MFHTQGVEKGAKGGKLSRCKFSPRTNYFRLCVSPAAKRKLEFSFVLVDDLDGLFVRQTAVICIQKHRNVTQWITYTTRVSRLSALLVCN